MNLSCVVEERIQSPMAETIFSLHSTPSFFTGRVPVISLSKRLSIQNLCLSLEQSYRATELRAGINALSHPPDNAVISLLSYVLVLHFSHRHTISVFTNHVFYFRQAVEAFQTALTHLNPKQRIVRSKEVDLSVAA